MNANKKYIAALVFTLLIAAFAVSVYQSQKQVPDKSVVGLNKKKITEVQDLKQHVSPMTSGLQPELADSQYTGDSLEPATLIKPTDTADSNDLQKNTAQSEKFAKENLASLIAKLLSHQVDSNEPNDVQLADNFSILLNEQASLKDRCRAAWNLAKNGDKETLLILREILFDPSIPASLRATIAEALGYSHEPLAKEMLLAALADNDDTVVRGAIRGLSATGDKDAISILSDFLHSENVSSSVLAEAAMGLGKIKSEEAYKTLIESYYDAEIAGNVNLQKDIIVALGQRNITEISSIFQQILEDTTSDPSLRVAVIEALEDSQGDTIPLLLKYLYDSDSEVRAAAAWALATADEPGDLFAELKALLAVEQDPEVRKRLYQALGNQKNVDIENIDVQTILKETDIETRLAGYDLLARNLTGTENKALLENFNQMVIPDLKQIALTADRISTKLSAVITLKRANTPESLLALHEIATQSSDKQVIEAIGA